MLTWMTVEFHFLNSQFHDHLIPFDWHSCGFNWKTINNLSKLRSFQAIKKVCNQSLLCVDVMKIDNAAALHVNCWNWLHLCNWQSKNCLSHICSIFCVIEKNWTWPMDEKWKWICFVIESLFCGPKKDLFVSSILASLSKISPNKKPTCTEMHASFQNGTKLSTLKIFASKMWWFAMLCDPTFGNRISFRPTANAKWVVLKRSTPTSHGSFHLRFQHWF